MKVTIFKNVLASSAGFHRDVSVIFDRIKTGASKKIVDQIRKEQDGKKKNDIKRGLPAICFSGTFNRRADNSMIQHSGLICLDFDKFPDEKTLSEQKETLIKDSYTFALFISPSGLGLKVIVKIPPVYEDHRKYFRSLQQYYNCDYFDKACINESRVCYESYDPDIYVNQKSKVFDRKLPEQHYDVSNDKSVLPVKSENQIITNLMKWFHDNYIMSEGSRNANLFVLASAFNDFGVNKSETERTLLSFATTDFTDREIESIISSAYKKKQNHGTKFFEDEHAKKKIKERIKSGDDLKKIKQALPEYTADEIEHATEDIKRNLAVTEFWNYDKNNKISLSHHKYKQFLEQNGFYKMFPAGGEGYIFIYIRENLINNITSTHIKDYILNYLYDREGNLNPYDFMASATKYFKEDYLTLLETSEVKLKEDTKDKCYLYFRNCVVEVSEKSIKTIDYLDLEGYVWEKHIINRDFKEADPTGCIFEQFITRVAGNDMERYKSLISVIGYLLHSFKTNSNNKAIIFNDETISETPNGGSGKGIICNAISHMKRVATIDGKQFDFNKSFPYQTVSTDTHVLVFDDVKKNFQFENLFSLVTEGITLEKKNKDAIKLPVHKSPKIVITTNYTIGGTGGSFERRKFEVELSSYFSEKHTPWDEYGHYLFDEWEEKEWDKFNNFMILCVQFYLKNGLVSYEFHNLGTRKLINNTAFEFYEWIEDEKLQTNTKIEKREVFTKFLDDHEDFKKFTSMKKFSRWLDLYAGYKGYEIIRGKTNGVRYVIYRNGETTEIKQDEGLQF